MDQFEINLFALDDEMQECGFETSGHLAWEDSLGRTVQLIPNYEMPDAGGIWCLAVAADDASGIIAFAMAVRPLLPENFRQEVPKETHQVGFSEPGNPSVAYYFPSLVLEQIGY